MKYDSELTEHIFKLSEKEGVVADCRVGNTEFRLVYIGDLTEYEYAILKIRKYEIVSDMYDDQEEAFAEFHNICGHEMD